MLKNLKKSVKNSFRAVFFEKYVPPSKSVTSAPSVNIDNAPMYPPIDQGIQLSSVQSVIKSQIELIERIQKTAGLNAVEFNELYMPVIENLVKYVHLLPATRTGHHRGAGGLLRLALEMSLYSLQIANSTIFISKGEVSAEARYKLHPRWVYATFVAGACAELYRAITDMVVTDENGNKWPQLLIPLYSWITEQKVDKYHVVWNVQDEIDVVAMHRATAAYILNVVAPMSGRQYLIEGNSEILTALTSCVTNSVPHGVKNQIAEITNSVRRKVIERDLKRNGERYGDFSVGAHLEPHLLDAMRKLLKKNTWEINVKGARIWYSKEGMFIVWQPAAREIIEVLKEENLPGIPNEADTLADLLINSGVAECNDKEGRYWEICIPTSMQILSAIKLQRVEILFNEPSEIKEHPGTLLTKNIASTVTAASAVKNDATVSSKIDGAGQGIASVSAETKVPAPSSHIAAKPIDNTQAAKPKQQAVVVDEKSSGSGQPTAILAVPVAKTPSGGDETKAEKNSESQELADKLFSSMPSEAADYLRAIVEDHQDASSAGPIFSTEDGVAISVQELESHGQSNFTGLVKVLYDKSWLWTSPQKPMCKLYDLKHEGANVRAIVIRKDIARGMGFEWKQPKIVKGS